MELELAWYGDGDFGRVEVARVRDVHLIIFHAQLCTCSVVVAKRPYGCHDAHCSCLRVSDAFPYNGDPALFGNLNHLDVSGVVLVDSM